MYPAIWFSYPGDDYAEWREVVCRKLTEAVSTVIPLPKEIVIRVANLGPSIYGSAALEHRYKNRVCVNSTLSAREVPAVLVHELIHLSQIDTGVLRASRTGTYFWNNHPVPVNLDTLTYEQHQLLPWEIDVNARHAEVFMGALCYAMKRSLMINTACPILLNENAAQI